jgi:hypothetical protein
LPNTDGRREVNDVRYAIETMTQYFRGRDIPSYQICSRNNRHVPLMNLWVKVIEEPNSPAMLEKALGQVRADEPRTSRDKNQA